MARHWKISEEGKATWRKKLMGALASLGSARRSAGRSRRW
jgi:hypothetical protein